MLFSTLVVETGLYPNHVTSFYGFQTDALFNTTPAFNFNHRLINILIFSWFILIEKLFILIVEKKLHLI